MRPTVYILLMAGLALGMARVLAPAAVPRTAGSLPSEVYVWQRAWTPAVREAVSGQTSRFSRLIPLHAEVSWERNQPRLARIAVNFEALRIAEKPAGIALRIGPWPGPFHNDDSTTRWLKAVALDLVEEAAENGITVAELQLDFDCAESKLDGYRIWVDAVRRAVAPVPVTITALPSWLDQPAFRKLAAAADGYVLQVHSIARPRHADQPLTICNAAAARKAVERAGRLGIPFRVALPTYGYEVAFNKEGEFMGISAEASPGGDPGEGIVREILADPDDMAALVAGWIKDRPAALTGIVWYRLPVIGDRLNWDAATLAAVIEGRAPETRCVIETISPDPRLVDVSLVNSGEGSSRSLSLVRLGWNGGRLAAGGGLAGFELRETSAAAVEFKIPGNLPPPRLAPGQRLLIGWLRFDEPVEVRHENN